MKKTSFLLASLLLCSAAAYAQTADQANMQATGNALIGYEINHLTKDKDSPDWLKRTDIGFSIESDAKPVYFLETIQPLSQNKARTDFFQLRYGNDLSAGKVLNVGLGTRSLNSDQTSLFGINSFYDYGFKYGHSRVGLGLEYFNGLAEYRANMYHPTSGEKLIDPANHIFQKAISGYDYEIGTALPKAPWMKVFIQGFSWDYKYSDDAIGYKLRTEIQVTPRLNFELGYWDDNKGPGEKYAKMLYSLGNQNGPAMFEKGKKMFRSGEKVTVSDKVLQKVTRDNDIRVETYTKASGSSSGVPLLSIDVSAR